jgi:hypothetical protein
MRDSDSGNDRAKKTDSDHEGRDVGRIRDHSSQEASGKRPVFSYCYPRMANQSPII